MRKYLGRLKAFVLDIFCFIQTRIYLSYDEEYKKLKIDKQAKLILLDLPTHANLGDHAIAVSEYNFIKKKYLEKHIYRFSFNQCRFCLNQITKYISDMDKIYLPGGGFLGTLWKSENKVILNILSVLKSNRIVIFPQTIYFDEADKIEIEKFRSVVNNNKHLTICAREKKSYSTLKEIVDCEVLLVPDIVLTYEPKINKKKNGKILLCFRQDKERVYHPETLIKYLDIKKILYDFGSTIADKKIGIGEAQDAVDKKIEFFSNYSLVICDRLHAMIFSYIGRTPCLAFDNLSKKIGGVHKWIESIEGSYCVADDNFKLDDISKLIDIRVEKLDLSEEFLILYQAI